MGVRAAWRPLALALSFILLNLALAVLSFKTYPVERGTPEGFWNAMFHLGPYFGGVYPTQRGLCVYYHQGMHGRFLYSVPEAELGPLPTATRSRALAEATELSKKERATLEAGGDLASMIDAHIAADRERWATVNQDGGRGHDAEQASFLERRGRVRRYWVNIVFEGLFLNALLLLAWIPFRLKLQAHAARATCAGLLLPLFFTPYYLGYCPWAFTSAGATGGILYPWMLGLFYGCPMSGNAVDDLLLAWLGSPLEPMSQDPGFMWSVSGGGGVSPTFSTGIGCLIGIGVYFVSRAVAKRQSSRGPLKSGPPAAT